ncbi:MAG: Glu-tRNA(Gln) amidotransferase subunit GatE [Candidatus Nitrosocaldus sp.]|nr:Glu-tRNA(Gln) amidotransferase subunit GatE [Candidatus Nitrosocaldus sp.]MCS7141669.1 Glu-tRNA(Gln) amidotransferase subunit GatE [Candidatus Nitrosocaldus sp.]MDW8000688.1 Glu-tRNA(Gln) amidotransferase subunit GatE [Candidatus Nitrosocaldus sp.]MDW8276261.1 Glu-tRNA(Gln) amidotransferase subunit GatE [Candidatus Nitrosocaldus sp.]
MTASRHQRPSPSQPAPSASPDPYAIGLRVGFEVHQQLATRSKLFCSCRCDMSSSDAYDTEFFRRLRPAHSELGEYDPAALFEFRKGKIMRYLARKGTSCLVEMDEEPPHDINMEALETALVIALALNADVVDEVHVMRKIVIDGSNTTGFQRTMLIATGGSLRVRFRDGERDVRVQSICLEEDAARVVGDDAQIRTYALDRLGIPLVEIALEPVTGTPEELTNVALTLGRLLRATRRVARGLGSIRQDVNVSIDGGGVVEVKGVQRLDQLRRVIEYEMKRQYGLKMIAERLRGMEWSEPTTVDVSGLFRGTASKVLRTALDGNGVVKALALRGLGGMLSYEPYEGIRLGRELGELVRFYGLGGIFHSDELPAYGISREEVDAVRRELLLGSNDAFILLAGKEEGVDDAMHAVIERLRHARLGVPAETRAAAQDGRTVYSRPRPGAARMYPETDIPPIPISRDMLSRLRDSLPRGWDEYVDELSRRYGINRVLAEKVFDSDHLELFERIARSTSVQPSFIASTLTETMVNLERQGLDASRLRDEHIEDVFARVSRQEIAKESVASILGVIMQGKADSVQKAIDMLGLRTMSDEELSSAIDGIIRENYGMVEEKGEKALGILMGIAMSRLRGRVDGSKLNAMLKSRVEEIIRKK